MYTQEVKIVNRIRRKVDDIKIYSGPLKMKFTLYGIHKRVRTAEENATKCEDIGRNYLK